jgi:predicted GIY-YIG superfamily endonuclease
LRQKIEELKRESIGVSGACSGVYFLFNGTDLVYIGEGWNCFLRVAEHTRKESDKVFTSWNFIPIGDEQERKARERALRAEFKPKYNKR